VPSDASVTDAYGEPLLTEKGIELASAQLAFHQDRIAAGSDYTSRIAQFIILIFGAVSFAAIKVPEVIIVLPLFWSAWLLHAQQREADTTKHALLARRLEAQLNRAVGGKPVAAWNSALTAGSTNEPRPIVSMANVVYWILVYLGSWIAAIVVMFQRHHETVAIATIVGSCLVSGVALVGFIESKAFKQRCLNELDAYVERWRSSSLSGELDNSAKA
jgi:hypothetical protein